MGYNKTADGRDVLGLGVQNRNDYHGFNGKRDIVIQLTQDGTDADGLNALEYLKAFALNANAENKPIFPSGTRVWISANGYTKAVEADDIVIDGSNVTIGGIMWNGSAWDFSNAGQSGGGSGGGVLVVTDTNGTLDKTWQDIVDAEYSVLKHQEGVGYYKYDPLSMAYTGPGDDETVVYVVAYGQAQFATTSASGYPSEG